MSGFRKAKGEQAALKVGIYGPSGSGKTLTSLLLAEGLAKREGKRVAFVDTERGTDFYAQAVPERAIHPEAFDFDALYERSLLTVLDEVKALDPNKYAVVVIDSITHLWEAARNAYEGRLTKASTIPMNAWGAIKKPYKDLVAYLLNSPMHFIICGREGNEFAKDDVTGEMTLVGKKMKAEGETAYEPHILIQMESTKGKKSFVAAYFEKDRTGILKGKTVANPTFEVFEPLLALLGGTQAQIKDEDTAAVEDGDKLAQESRERTEKSRKIREQFTARFQLATGIDEVEKIGKDITAAMKKEMFKDDVDALRESYLTAKEKHGKAVVNA